MKLAPGLIVAGIGLSFLGVIVWSLAWTKAKSAARVAEMVNAMTGGYGARETTLYTSGVISGIVVVGLGVLLALVGLIGYVIQSAVRPAQAAAPAVPDQS